MQENNFSRTNRKSGLISKLNKNDKKKSRRD